VAQEYLTLATSLPHLDYFERAHRLPLTERGLTQRLSMLEEDDATQLKRAVNLLRWQRHAVAARTEQIEKQYRTIMEKNANTALREYVDWRINGRTALAALRLKARGQSKRPDQPWGAGRLVRPIEANWEKPDFGLRALFPWLDEARKLLAGGDALSLDRLDMRVVWHRLEIMGEIDPFGFEYVAAYVFKWEILQHWLAFEPQKAEQRFQKLIQEVIGEQRLVA
jgi:hypothetical protein